MAVFFVNQGVSYAEESHGGYVWAPQRNRSGNRNAGFSTMTDIHQNDFIIHNKDSIVKAISVASTDCYNAQQPSELYSVSNNSWTDEGYRVDCAYYVLDNPIDLRNIKDWLVDHADNSSAFTRVGTCKQQYMCHITEKHAIYILEKALEVQNTRESRNVIQSALEDIVGDLESEYDSVEIENINTIVESSSETVRPVWQGIREPQAMTESSGTGRAKPKRDPQRAANALMRANYCCEYDMYDRTFIRKNGKPYTEPHHLIPISKYRDFDYSVDVMENIVSLCSHCHNLLHYGRLEDKKPVLRKLYEERVDALHTVGLDITLEQLYEYYK